MTCASYNPLGVQWTRVYAALYEIMACEKRTAGMLIRMYFHEAGNPKPIGAAGDGKSGPNLSGMCSNEHRRSENVGRNFFDHSMAMVLAVAKETGASPMDVMAMAAFVAYEVTGGSSLTQSLAHLQVGRCNKAEFVDAATPASDPIEVLPAGSASTLSFMTYWQDLGFPAAEAAALMATHTLVDNKVRNMHEFDSEFIDINAQNWAKLGYTCRLRNVSSDVPSINLTALGGDERITAFTSDSGRLINQELRATYPPTRPSVTQTNHNCICFDPQLDGMDESIGRGAWPFTTNDCNVWITCNLVRQGLTAGIDQYTQDYCNAFVTFSNSPEVFASTLVAGTARVLSPAIFVNNAPATINYQAVRAIAHVQRAFRQYGRLCSSDTETPCNTDTLRGCETATTRLQSHCDPRNVTTFFPCMTTAVLTPNNVAARFGPPKTLPSCTPVAITCPPMVNVTMDGFNFWSCLQRVPDVTESAQVTSVLPATLSQTSSAEILFGVGSVTNVTITATTGTTSASCTTQVQTVGSCSCPVVRSLVRCCNDQGERCRAIVSRTCSATRNCGMNHSCQVAAERPGTNCWTEKLEPFYVPWVTDCDCLPNATQ
jgi:hypothetical protein